MTGEGTRVGTVVDAFVGTANMGAFVGTGNVGAGTCPPAGEQADTDARTIRAIVPISNFCFFIIVSLFPALLIDRDTDVADSHGLAVYCSSVSLGSIA